MTRLEDLNKYHEQNMVAKVRKLVDNVFSKSYISAALANDICWMWEEPQIEKQHGRAHRIYERLNSLRRGD